MTALGPSREGTLLEARGEEVAFPPKSAASSRQVPFWCPDFRVILLAAAFPSFQGQWPTLRLSSPITVAGPCWICTSFPVLRVTGTKPRLHREHPSISNGRKRCQAEAMGAERLRIPESGLARDFLSKRGMHTSRPIARRRSGARRPKAGRPARWSAVHRQAGLARPRSAGRPEWPGRSIFQAGDLRHGGRAGQEHAAVLQHGSPTSPLRSCRRFLPRPPARRPANAAGSRETAPAPRPAARNESPLSPGSPIGPTRRPAPRGWPDNIPAGGRPMDDGRESPGYRSVRGRAGWPRRRWGDEPPPPGRWRRAAIGRHKTGSIPATASALASDRAASSIGRRPRRLRGGLRQPPCSKGRQREDRAEGGRRKAEGGRRNGQARVPESWDPPFPFPFPLLLLSFPPST